MRNSNLIRTAILVITILIFTGFVSTKTSFVSENSENLYYGADLTKFPPKVREWIMNTAFTKNMMESVKNSKLKVWWHNDNNQVLIEAYVYNDAGVKKTLMETKYSGNPDIFKTYGKYAKYQTLKFKWELEQEVENLLKNDTMYAEIIEFAKQLCQEIEYDWANYGRGRYKRIVKQTPNKKYLVCDGYANEVMDKALNLSCVKAVQKWTSSNHAWNVLKLVDGRTLYFDLTWFDNEYFDKKTGEIVQTDDYGWANITFNKKLFRYSDVGYGTRIFEHKLGKFAKERKD